MKKEDIKELSSDGVDNKDYRDHMKLTINDERPKKERVDYEPSAKRPFLVMLLALLVVAALFIVPSIMPKDPNMKNVQDNITYQLDGLKNLDEDAIDNLYSIVPVSNLGNYGITKQEMYDALLSDFDYKIESITVDPDGLSASADVSMTIKDLTDLQYELSGANNKEEIISVLENMPTKQVDETIEYIHADNYKDLYGWSADPISDDNDWVINGGNMSSIINDALFEQSAHIPR